MSATVGRIGKGTAVGFSNNSSTSVTTLTALAEVLDLNVPKQKAAPLKIHRYDSPSLFPELVAGWCENTDGNLKLTYNAAQGALIYPLLNTLCSFCFVKPDLNGYQYVGMLTEFGDEVPLKDKMMNVFNFAVSGAPQPITATISGTTITTTAVTTAS